MAFVDGQNLFQHAKAAFGHFHPNYDVKALHDAVCASLGLTPNLVRFYTGVPDAARDPKWAGYWSNRVLALKRQGVNVTTRKLKYRDISVPQADGSARTEAVPQEKGIDVRLALDIVKFARKKSFDCAVLYSQDQDLNEVVQEIREIAMEQGRDIKVYCAFPDSPAATSRRGIDGTQWVRIDRETYDACIDPRDFRPSNWR